MSTEFLTTKEFAIEKFISNKLMESSRFDWAVAYGSYTAFDILKNEFKTFFKKGGISRAIFDISDGITNPAIIEELITIPGESSCKVFIPQSGSSGILHQKIYIFDSQSDKCALIGSANFSRNAFRNNLECGVVIQGKSDKNTLVKIDEYFENELWNSPRAISPELNPEILEEYTRLFKQKKSSRQRFTHKAFNDINELLNNLIAANTDYSKIRPNTSYILGLLCANSNSLHPLDVSKRKLTLNFRKQALNSKSKDKGYICANINGEILGGIRLPQVTTQISRIRLICKELETLIKNDSIHNTISLEDRSTHITNIYIHLNFADDSKLWGLIIRALKQFSIKKTKKRTKDVSQFIPTIPKEIIKSANIENKRAFLKGYFDFRSRISTGDRFPNGPLRIALGISTLALKFATELEHMLKDAFNIHSVLEDGTSRGKDHVLRFKPNQDTLQFFSKGWQKLMVQEFIKFNAKS